MVPFIFLALGKADWPSFRVNEAEVAFQMPTKPDRKVAMFHNMPMTFYTASSENGLFVVGYNLFPKQIKSEMHHRISTNPGDEGIHSLLSMTVSDFAKAGKAKVVHPEFGLDRGLPTEFALLDNGHKQLRIRVYLGSVATYMFVTTSAPEFEEHFFDSIRLPAEVTKS